MGNNKKSVFHRDLPSDDEMPMYRAFREISTSRQTSRDTSRQTSLLSLLQGLMKGVATYKRTFISDRMDTKYYVLA